MRIEDNNFLKTAEYDYVEFQAQSLRHVILGLALQIFSILLK